MKTYFFTCALILSQLCSFAQHTSSKRISDNLTHKNFIFIEIDHSAERYYCKEINLIYLHSTSDTTSVLKIHSITYSNYLPEARIDTSFILNSGQWNKLDSFANVVKSGNCPRNEGLVIAGSYTTCKITVDKEVYECTGKAELSLIKELLLIKKD